MIALTDVSKTYDRGRSYVLRDLSISIEPNEIFVLLGESGSGKTTTLKMINRLIERSGGSIEIDGSAIDAVDPIELRRRFGYVFQGIGLFPHMTIEENASIVPRLLGWSRTRRSKRAREVLDLVGLDPDEFGNRMPRQLSGGQQQRVGVARALAADPDYLLMDEPFGALDAVTRDQLQRQLLEIRDSLSKTIVFVTHDLFEAVRLADRIAVMHNGRLDQVGAPASLLQTPATPYVESLFGHACRQAKELLEDLS